ncbi:MAG: HAMP domain-containing histidine kinase [Firmicutes bacterium]|nr:HAMP domain-containing histidine kinase [Bacillota bacterium]
MPEKRRAGTPRNPKKGKKKRSIYFVLWAVFTAFSLLIVLLFGVSQSVALKQSYENAAMKETFTTGSAVKAEYERLADRFGAASDPDDFFRAVSSERNVCAALLDENGEVIYPVSGGDVISDGAKVAAKDLIQKLKNGGAQGGNVFELGKTDAEGVYVGVTNDGYLLVSRRLDINSAMMRQLNGRTVLIAVFVLVLSFVISATVSGFLVRPLAEMTEKAKRLAAGDFSVDFRGQSSYGAETDALAETLNFARDEISKADSMQKELIANVSHDFKTPLTMIKAYASMIQEISGGDPVKREKHAQVIIDEADRLTELVTDVLDLSKISSGVNEIKRETFDLSAFTAQVLEKFGYLAETQGYVFETHIERGLYTDADRVKIGQVIYNLVGNAVNYTGADKRVIVALRREENGILFSVKDTGAGVKKEELRDIWNRYYRSKEAHKRPVKGSGLGLSIVQTVLEKHGFRYGVNSEEGKGCEFYVLFPLL